MTKGTQYTSKGVVRGFFDEDGLFIDPKAEARKLRRAQLRRRKGLKVIQGGRLRWAPVRPTGELSIVWGE